VKSVGARLTSLFVLLTAVILAVFAGSLYLWVRDWHSRMLDDDLAVQSRLFQDRFLHEVEETRNGIHTDLAALLEDFLIASEAEGEVVAADGKRIFTSKGFSAARPGFRRREATVKTASGESFTVRLALSEEPFQLALRQLEIYFALFIPPVLVLAGVFGFLFVRRALAPVGRIRRQAERISRANVSERVPVPAESGEFQDLARTFNEMLDRLDHAFQDLTNFAADAAHELRTPLATLRAELDTAIQQPRSAEDHERMLLSLAEEVARMNRIVSDLFTLAKIDMRQYALQKERVELRALLDEAREVWQDSAEESGLEIVREGPPVVVAGDPVALRRVFMNLIENAIKYNRPGGKIHLSTEELPGKARVRVRDTGMGIAAEDLPRLFKRFYRVDKARSRDSGGAGLGLAICKSFIEAHGGTIGVESALGVGTTFTIEFPADGEPAPAAPSVFSEVRPAGRQ
jgi:heavy metal sensor kinase